MPRLPVPCRQCGSPCNLGSKSSRRDPLCMACFRLWQRANSVTRVVCAGGCGKIVQRGHDSATEPTCLDCIRVRPEYKGRWQPAEHRLIMCEICGKQIPATTNRDTGSQRQKTCGSDDCRKEVTRRRKKSWQQRESLANLASCRIWVGDCVECGRLFTGRAANQVTCSDECRRRRLIGRVLDRHYGYVKNAMREGPLLAYLVKRDRGRCGICRKPVRAKKGPMRPSIDHIQPRSLGGSDDLANLHLAHLRCNLSKNAGGGGEQLLLVG